MEIWILGAHQGESDRYRFFSLMLSESLALDAGSIASGLSWEAQAKVRSLLLTHAHFDHVKDLNVLGFNHFNRGLHLDVYCLPVVRDAIRNHMFNRDVWLDLSARPTPENPTVTFYEVDPYRTFTLEGFEITPIPSIHTVPAVGYRVSREGRSFYYTSDTGPGNVAQWAKAAPDLLITEVTYDSSMDRLAVEVSHLTPNRLKMELVSLKEALGRIPRVLVVHVNPVYEKEIARELAEVARELGSDITLAYEGMKVIV
ncbi:MAG: MBL fold metallo-hydrolase [Dehalococcoidia bacterium]|nr:MBL fold metallo-hydrolase [Dehalococcoidia bacterium]